MNRERSKKPEPGLSEANLPQVTVSQSGLIMSIDLEGHVFLLNRAQAWAMYERIEANLGKMSFKL